MRATLLLMAGMLALSGSAAADPLETKHCPWGCPDKTPAEDTIVKRNIYDLANDPDTKFPDWVAYSVTKSTIGGSETRDWQTDLELGEYTLTEKDWTGANEKYGYEKGHLAPLADFTGLDKETWEEANILSNIAPQCGTLNNGPWKGLEDAERELVRSIGKSLFIVVGTQYTGDMPALPKSKRDHVVPSTFWKVLALKSGDKIEVAAFQFDQYLLAKNKQCKRGTFQPGVDFCGELVPLKDIEKQARLDIAPLASSSNLKDSSAGKTSLLDGLGCELIE